MKKFSFVSMQFFVAFLTVCFFFACSSDDGNSKLIELVGGTSTDQTVYADQTKAEGGIKFTAQAAWTAVVAEMADSRAVERNNVDWLTLSAYSGGAGEHTIAVTLKENRTGSDRKAKITITCGDTVITIIVEQKSVKEDGTKLTPATPGDNYDKLITKIVEHQYYSTGSYMSDDGEETYEFFYDDNKRLVKIVQTESDDWEIGPQSKKSSSRRVKGTRASGTDVYVTTVNISYEDGKLSCELSQTKNGVANKEEVYKASAVLDEALRVVSGEYTDSDYKDDLYLYNTTYTLHYDADGYLVKSNRVEDGDDVDEERITWTNGNPTQVWWGTTGSTSSGTKDLIDKTTYGKVVNNSNLDLNWFIALDSEGWDFAVGDPYKTFAIMGYVGKRSANLAETMTDASEASNGGSVVTRYTYQLADDGMPSVIKKETKHSDFTESSTYTITYNK